MVFCNECYAKKAPNTYKVTILILIDGFLQSVQTNFAVFDLVSHNPYFNRWFSAMWDSETTVSELMSHNPYFNRWFSAITEHEELNRMQVLSQSLF